MNGPPSCPLSVGVVTWLSAAGQWMLTVVAKATYVLSPDESPLAGEQDAIHEADVHWNDDEQRSLHAASDLVPFKRRADVVLVGHAFAPGGRPVQSLVARLRVGEIDKAVEVFGERAFALDGSLCDGHCFTKMPLAWERAAGGPATFNPAGVHPDAAPDRHGMVALPNLQPPGLHVRTRRDPIAPVGFGPIAPAWPSRRAMLEPGLTGWDFRGFHTRPLPIDLDPGFFNVAPPDQQLDWIRSGEHIVLENLHREHPRLETSLAQGTPYAVLGFAGGASDELPMRADTLCIDTDRGRCTLCWRVQILLDEARPVLNVGVVLREDSVPAPPAFVTPGSVGSPTYLVAQVPAIESAPSVASSPLSPPPPITSVLEASNLAADVSGSHPAEPEPEAKHAPAVETRAAPQAPAVSTGAVELLWFERASLPRIRKKPEWRALIAALEDRPPDPELDDATLGSSQAEIEDRRDVFEILTRGDAIEVDAVEEALAGAIRDDGKIVPPLVLVAGTVAFPLDELESLRAHVALIAPLSAGDEKLRGEIALVREYLSTPDFACAPQMVETLSSRLWEAFERGKRAVGADTLRAHAGGALLQKRRLQRRDVFGGSHLRTLFLGPPPPPGTASTSPQHLPAYLPASLASALPLFPQFRARILAEVHLPIDQMESAPAALRVVALARIWQRGVARPPETGDADSAARARRPDERR